MDPGAGRILLVLLVLLTLGMCGRGHAHDPNAPLGKWFNELRSDQGPCCSNSDGKVVEDADWESRGGHYRVKLDGKWVDVPDGAVVTVPNLYGKTMVWPTPTYLFGPVNIRCFMPGVMM